MDGRDAAVMQPALALPEGQVSAAMRDRRRGPTQIFLWLPALLFLATFFFLPLTRILAFGLGPQAIEPANLRLAAEALGFTLYQATLSTLLTLAVGLPAAALFAYFDFPGKVLLRTLTAVPFMLPTVVVAAAFNALLGPRGWMNIAIMRSLDLASPPIVFAGTLGAILIAHVFYNTTIVIRLVGGALSSLDPRISSAAATLGAPPNRVTQEIVLPLVSRSLLAATLLVFLFNFTSFGVILLLGGPGFATLEVQTYIQAVHFLDLPLAALLSLVQLLCTVVFSVLYSRMALRRPLQSTPRPAAANTRRASTARQRIFVVWSALVLGLLFVVPLLSLPLRSVARLEAERAQASAPSIGLTSAYYRELFVNRQGSLFYVPPVRAAANSLAYACATVVLSLLLGFPAARALAQPGRLERWLDPLLLLPLGASAVTLGLGFILTFSRWLASPWLVPVAHTIIALPFVVRALQPALSMLPRRLRDAAASLGASPWRTWLAVDWPILRRASASAAGFAFTISLGEFGATSLLVRPEYPTIPVAIYRFLSQPGGLNFGQAMAMATILMVLTTLGILAIERLRLPGTSEF